MLNKSLFPCQWRFVFPIWLLSYAFLRMREIFLSRKFFESISNIIKVLKKLTSCVKYEDPWKLNNLYEILTPKYLLHCHDVICHIRFLISFEHFFFILRHSFTHIKKSSQPLFLSLMNLGMAKKFKNVRQNYQLILFLFSRFASMSNSSRKRRLHARNIKSEHFMAFSIQFSRLVHDGGFYDRN